MRRVGMKRACCRNMGTSPYQTTSKEVLEYLKTYLSKKLQRELNLLARYDDLIQDQLATGIVERVTSEPVGREFYVTYKPVIRESAESTINLSIVHDASAKANKKSPSDHWMIAWKQDLLFRTWPLGYANSQPP